MAHFHESSSASLASLPAELFDDVCSRLSQRTLAILACTSKEIKNKVQNALYYHASVRGCKQLARFTRTLNDAAGLNSRGIPFSKNVHDLKLVLDLGKEAREGKLATAAVLGKEISIVTRYCPRVRIRLVLDNASCLGQPIASFPVTVFLNVTALVLNTGPEAAVSLAPVASNSRSPISNSRTVREDLRVLYARDTTCGSRKAFWTGIFNGTSFPALEEVEINHRRCVRGNWSIQKIDARELQGLRTLTRLVVDRVPELDDAVLESALECAPNLKHLELKNIGGLSYPGLVRLIVHALPNLNHFTLHVSPENSGAARERAELSGVDPLKTALPASFPVHLCPLVREHCKSLPHLDLYLPYVCRELFLTVTERVKLAQAGVAHLVSGRYGGKGDGDMLDHLSTRAIVMEHRKALAHAHLQAAVKKNMADAKAAGKDKTDPMARYEEEQKQTARLRMIRDGHWTRVLRCGKGLCRNYEAWEELGELARLDEEKIEWRLGHPRLNLGGIFTGQGIGIEKEYDEMFESDSDDDFYRDRAHDIGTQSDP